MKLRHSLPLVLALLLACASSPAEALEQGDTGAGLLLSQRCTGEPQERGFPRFARLMHDPQWMEWPSRMADPDWPRGFHLNWYPETVPLWRSPRGGDGRFAYDREWLEYLRDLQPNDGAAVWIARVAAGLFNRGNEFISILDLEKLRVEPVAESISSGGNVVRILEVKSGSGRLDMLFFRQGPPDPGKVNYENTPWLITKFTSVSLDGQLGNAGGLDVYFPNVAKYKNGYWVDLGRIEWFPRLPYCATTRLDISVRAQPSHSSSVVATLAAGQAVVLREYLPQGSDVWGRIDSGWIALEYQMDGQPAYSTSWNMDTRPPIVFD